MESRLKESLLFNVFNYDISMMKVHQNTVQGPSTDSDEDNMWERVVGSLLLDAIMFFCWKTKRSMILNILYR
ncbi:hypothetical protein ACET3Z_013203 [Daucus carota]